MAPLPAPEPARQLETTASLDVRKLRFEVNRMQLPMGVEGTFGMVKHPGASLAVPVLATAVLWFCVSTALRWRLGCWSSRPAPWILARPR